MQAVKPYCFLPDLREVWSPGREYLQSLQEMQARVSATSALCLWLLRIAKAEHALPGGMQWVWSVPQFGQGHGHLSTCRNQRLFLGNKDEGNAHLAGKPRLRDDKQG